MRRREVLASLGVAAMAPMTGRAQAFEERRIGVLMGAWAEDDPISRTRMQVLRERLSKHGWIEGRNLRIEYRWGRGDINLINASARELIALRPDAVIGVSTSAALALKRESSTTPIVFVNVTDPVKAGLAYSQARPGTNSTGVVHFEPAMATKWLEMLKEAQPSTTRVGILYSPKTLPTFDVYMGAIEVAATHLKIKPIGMPANDAAELGRMIDAFAREPGGSLLVWAPGWRDRRDFGRAKRARR
jgi:ABC-type uncharacterized transport system substrate-binding protein